MSFPVIYNFLNSLRFQQKKGFKNKKWIVSLRFFIPNLTAIIEPYLRGRQIFTKV